MMANPPFGVDWKDQQPYVLKEHEQFGFAGRFGPGLPRINDGSPLFLLHMLSKRRPGEDEEGAPGDGSKITIVFSRRHHLPLCPGRPAEQTERNWRRYAERVAACAFGIEGDLRLARGSAAEEKQRQEQEQAQDPEQEREEQNPESQRPEPPRFRMR